MQPTPGPQQSLVRRNTATGNQAATYFLSFYNGDASCSQVSKVYDPIQDPLNIGLYSNPIRIDRTQSDCFSIAYGVSWGVVSATSRYLSFRQFASNDCSGSFKDFVRMISPSMQSAPGTCFSFSVTSAVQLFYRVAVANPSVSALGYKLPSFGHEEMDYDPATGKVWMTTAYEKDSVFSVDLARTADATRPTQFGGVGYATVEQHTLNGDAYFTNVDMSSGNAQKFKTLGVRGCGVKTEYATILTPGGPVVRHRIWFTRSQLLAGSPFSSPYGGATVLDYSKGSNTPQQKDFNMSPLRTDVTPGTLTAGWNPDQVNYATNNKFMTANLFTPAFDFAAGMLINDVAVDPDNGDAFFSDSLNCRILKVNGTLDAQPFVWFFTANKGALCPFGYGQRVNEGGNPWNGATVIYGNGLDIYKNPRTGAKTIVMILGGMSDNRAGNTHNAVKIGIAANGDPIFDEVKSKITMNRFSMDVARFLNPFRPTDLYISQIQFNNGAINYNNPIDTKIGFQVVEFAPDQLSMDSAVDFTQVRSIKKYCSPAAGPIVGPSEAKGSAGANSGWFRDSSSATMQIKLYNSLDCNPSTLYSTTSDPAGLALASGVTNPISVPMSYACNNYGTNRAFKMRCLASEGSNGIFGSTQYQFVDYADRTACANAVTNPMTFNPSNVLFTSGSCQPIDTLYYIATCSSSGLTPNSVTFYTDSQCTTVSTTTAGTAGTTPALEHPCVAISSTSSISAGSLNDVLYGVGSVFLWTSSNACQGLNNVVNISPNDGECVRPDSSPVNEFTSGALKSQPVSYRFFLNKYSQACKGGVTGAILVPTPDGGELYGLCKPNDAFYLWGLSIVRFGEETRCDRWEA